VRKSDNLATSMHRLSGSIWRYNILEHYRVCRDLFSFNCDLFLEIGYFVSQTVTSDGMFPDSVSVQRQDKIDSVYIIVKCRQTDNVAHAFVDLFNLNPLYGTVTIVPHFYFLYHFINTIHNSM
jgi:hypothetical protein